MNQERLLNVLLAPHVSEKSAMNADGSNQHTFKVTVDATKLEVKRAVEDLFEVKVVSVRMMNVKGKNKRFSQRLGSRPSWKKAMVRLADGQDVEFAGMGG
ncbi:MAG: 50S ribosomal protein L23 [Gammaproteobacteria bacterium]|nr:50S ribosomal protein L23 [Gammaproteobacteria bacterium]MDQ7075824.1 50S ribosomal protein L23 [Gammaproteobacteria bacterium]